MFDFPASPSNGQMFTPVAGGPSYVFQTPVWRLAPGGVNSGVWVGDAPPSSPSQGTLWWESDSGNTFIYYDDGSSGQWVQFNSAPPPAGFVPITAQAQNRIVNGAMQHSQENGNTAGVVNVYYAADQWLSAISSTGAFSFQRVQVWSSNGSRDRLRLTVTTADTSIAAGEFLAIEHKIEGNRISDFLYGGATAKQSVLRFGFKAPAGTYAVALRNYNASRCYIATFTITAGQANADTTQTIVIPGDTTGTWVNDTGVGFDLWFTLACGSTTQGTVGWNAANVLGTAAVSNGAGVVNNVFELFDVGLYLDPDNTGLTPKWQTPDYADELLNCQRYWRQYGNLVVDTPSISQSTVLAPSMRIAPSATGGGAGFSLIQLQPNHVHMYQTARAYQTITLNARM